MFPLDMEAPVTDTDIDTDTQTPTPQIYHKGLKIL